MHHDQDGAFLLGLLISVLLSSMAGWGIAWRFRLAVRRLMAASPSPVPGPNLTTDPIGRTSARPKYGGSLVDNRKAQHRLVLALVTMCMFMGLLQALWTLHVLEDSEEGYNALRIFRLTAMFGWLMIPNVGLVYRWSSTRVLLLTIGYFLLTLTLSGWGLSTAEFVSLFSLPLNHGRARFFGPVPDHQRPPPSHRPPAPALQPYAGQRLADRAEPSALSGRAS
jgi:hypothetical protein